METLWITISCLGFTILYFLFKDYPALKWIQDYIGYTMNKRSKFAFYFYIILVSLGLGIFWMNIFPFLSLNWTHTFLSILTSISLYASFLNVCYSDPGYIHPQNHAIYLQKWGFDYILYEPLACKTCKFIKIPRSKHCSSCNRCIAKQDHHCIWVDNCIGIKNYYKFILFLIVNGWACSYGCFLTFKSIHSLFLGYGWEGKDVWAQSKDGTRFKLSEYEKWTFILRLFPTRGGLFLFTGMAALIVFGFLIYQLYINIIKGQTTNESFKWQEVAYYVRIKKFTLLPNVLSSNQSRQFLRGEISSKELDQPEVLIGNVKELNNMYDNGWKGNLLEYFY